MAKPKILTIVGPTASGKTHLTIEIAEKLKEQTGKEVEIISADSRQVYRHIPISTAQPDKADLRKFKHYFINELELEEDFNAGDFGKKGREVISKILAAGKIPIIAGGSGLYIDSLINGLFDYEEISGDAELKKNQKKIRENLYDELNKYGIEKLINVLKSVDPETVKTYEYLTQRRVIRALEVYYLTGIPISAHKSNKIDVGFEAVQYGIKMDRDELYIRINNRADEMIKKGLLQEIRKLKEKGFHYKDFNSLNSVGIKEVFDWLDKKITYDEMVELIKRNTRRFAKRQMTWFRRYNEIKWISPEFENVKMRV